jgi:hypothetical protein
MSELDAEWEEVFESIAKNVMFAVGKGILSSDFTYTARGALIYLHSTRIIKLTISCEEEIANDDEKTKGQSFTVIDGGKSGRHN